MKWFSCFSTLVLLWANPVLAQIAANPTSPALDSALCGPAFPGPSDKIWNGEMPRWTPASGRPMIQVSLVAYPTAICNDGSPAAMYVRPAPATLPNGQPNPLRKMFHIHLKGGGSCDGFTDCRERFCAQGGKATNKPGLMSSLGWAPAIDGTGLFRDRNANRFAKANQVLVGYCSSDTWIGSAEPGTTISLKVGDDAADVSSIAFMGEHIVQAVLDELDTGVTAALPNGEFKYKMRRLREADKIWITGDSGGANGARHHLDRIADRYEDAMVVGGLDAGGGVDMTDPRLDWSLMPSGATDFKEFMDTRVKQARSFYNVQDSALDASCKLANPGIGFDEQACFNAFDLERDHIATPLIHRVSLKDNTTRRSLAPMIPAPANQTIAQMTFDGLLELTGTNPVVSALGANCSRHVTFRNNSQIQRMKTLAAGLNLYRELELWVFGCFAAGTCPKMVALAPATLPAASACP